MPKYIVGKSHYMGDVEFAVAFPDLIRHEQIACNLFSEISQIRSAGFFEIILDPPFASHVVCSGESSATLGIKSRGYEDELLLSACLGIK